MHVFTSMPDQPLLAWRRLASTTVLVVALHAALIWVVCRGLAAPTPATVIPVAMLSALWDAPQPSAYEAPATAEVTPPPAAKKTSPKQLEADPPARQTNSAPDAAAAQAPALGSTGQANPAGASAASVADAAAGPVAPVAPSAGIRLPQADANYLQNPKPVYPALSLRLKEQGTTVLKVLVGVDGLPQRAEIAQTSSFDRLDQAALNQVMQQWRFVPGQRDGVLHAMWVSVPIHFSLR